MMNCRNVKKQINHYAEGILDESFCEKLEAHLKVCPECAQEWRKTQKLFHFLKSIPQVKAPVFFEAQLSQRLEEEPASIRRWLADSFGFMADRRFQMATITTCLLVVCSLVLLTVQNPFTGEMAKAPVAKAPVAKEKDVIPESVHRELAGIGYVLEDGGIELHDANGTGSVIYELVDQDQLDSSGQGIQPVSIMEVNF